MSRFASWFETKTRRLVGFPARLLVCAASVTFLAAADPPAGLTSIESALVDAHATGYATFQSHNQKVVSNSLGTFTTHIRTRNEAYTAQQWRLSRSKDGGRSFVTVYEATNACSAPAMETDKDGNIYLARPDFLDGNAYFYRFLASEEYSNPAVTKIPGGAAGKYCTAFDAPRRQIYYFAHNNTFHVLAPDGTVRSSVRLLRPGKHAVLQYPLLTLDRSGTLYAGWTTQRHGVYLYWDIHCMRSGDGGRSWSRLNGTPLELPVAADQNGPADRVTLDDEFESHTWLSSMLVKDGKLHLIYLAQTKPARQHYVRYDIETAAKDLDITPRFSGGAVSLRGLDGFLAASSTLRNGPLYCVVRSEDGGRLGCLASDDNGRTWYDYAVSEKFGNPYSVGGCREITADGYIVGSFTDQRAPNTDAGGTSRVYFIKIRAGLSGARVTAASFARGTFKVSFAEARGQPSRVRFRRRGGEWSKWHPFASELAVSLSRRPDVFQLESRLGVLSAAQELPAK